MFFIFTGLGVINAANREIRHTVFGKTIAFTITVQSGIWSPFQWIEITSFFHIVLSKPRHVKTLGQKQKNSAIRTFPYSEII